MKDAAATYSALAGQSNVASPHDRVDGTIRAIENASVDAVAAAGSVWSSVSDMAKWMRFCLEGTTPDGARLLEEETFGELFRPQAIVGSDGFYPTARLTRPKWTTYGLGWFQHDYQGRAVDFHTGSIDGMVAIHGLIRDERLGVYVLANLDHAELRHALMYWVFDRFGEAPARDWSRELRELFGGLAKEARERSAEAERTRQSGTTPSLPPTHYVGSYSDPLAGKVVVTESRGELRLRYGPGLDGALEHWHHDVFRVNWDKKWRGRAFVSFRLAIDGSVESVALDELVFRREASVE